MCTMKKPCMDFKIICTKIILSFKSLFFHEHSEVPVCRLPSNELILATTHKWPPAPEHVAGPLLHSLSAPCSCCSSGLATPAPPFSQHPGFSPCCRLWLTGTPPSWAVLLQILRTQVTVQMSLMPAIQRRSLRPPQSKLALLLSSIPF